MKCEEHNRLIDYTYEKRTMFEEAKIRNEVEIGTEYKLEDQNLWIKKPKIGRNIKRKRILRNRRRKIRT